MQIWLKKSKIVSRSSLILKVNQDSVPNAYIHYLVPYLSPNCENDSHLTYLNFYIGLGQLCL